MEETNKSVWYNSSSSSQQPRKKRGDRHGWSLHGSTARCLCYRNHWLGLVVLLLHPLDSATKFEGEAKEPGNPWPPSFLPPWEHTGDEEDPPRTEAESSSRRGQCQCQCHCRLFLLPLSLPFLLDKEIWYARKEKNCVFFSSQIPCEGSNS